MNILERIIAAKKLEIEILKREIVVEKLERSPLFARKCISLAKALGEPKSSGVIAEFKRRSPSKGDFFADAKSADICLAYQRASASALSILTNREFFGGKNSDIEEVRPLIEIPILRKEFIVDEYQLVEAKAIGADAILLIAACLDSKTCSLYAKFAKSLGLDVLLEVHSKDEISKYVSESIDLVGVNNRNLQSFQTNIDLSKQLAGCIPADFVKVAESGISEVAQVSELRKFGYQGFLIGENFMKTSDPGLSCENFIQGLSC